MPILTRIHAQEKKLFLEKNLYLLLFFLVWLLLFFPGLASGSQESSAESLLSQADIFYIQGDYAKARSLYLEATRLAEKNLHLSRAFFGAALCSYFLGEEEKVRENLRQVLAVDPKKEISALFYPPDFLKIFAEIKEQVLSGEGGKAGSLLSLEKMTEKTEGESGVQAREKLAKEKAEPEARITAEGREKETSPLREAAKPSFPRSSRYFLGGHWEIEVHYGRWSLEPVLSLMEKNITKRIGSEVRREIKDFLVSRYGSLLQSSYEQKLALEVEGWNQGLGLRYYSRGEAGSMSLGFSLERSYLKLKTAGSILQEFDNGSQAEVEASAFVQVKPFCGQVSFSWDFKPEWSIAPYFTIGLGFGTMNGRLGFDYNGVYRFAGYQEEIKDAQDKTFEAWKEEEGSHVNLEKIIFLQLSFGLRIEIYRGLKFLAEAGIWDGFLLRAGLAFRL